jgi:hypothetical protein
MSLANLDEYCGTEPMVTDAFERLSPLERERVNAEAAETLYAVFNAAHCATGWCGDADEECWKAGLPVMREAMARLMLRTR